MCISGQSNGLRYRLPSSVSINKWCGWSRHRWLARLPNYKPLLCHPQTNKIVRTQRKLRFHQLDPFRNRKINEAIVPNKNHQLSIVRGPCVRHFPASRLVPRARIKTYHNHIIQLPNIVIPVARTQRQRQRRRTNQNQHRSTCDNERIILH